MKRFFKVGTTALVCCMILLGIIAIPINSSTEENPGPVGSNDLLIASPGEENPGPVGNYIFDDNLLIASNDEENPGPVGSYSIKFNS